MDVHALPAVNATLNGIAAVLLAIGYTLIRQKRIQAHKRVMLTAFSVSVVFLVCYLIYHFNAGIVYYQKTGFLRYLYLTILTTHTILAVITPVLAIITLRRGLRMDVQRHRAIARWTFPIWMYVSVTGVVVYLMLYRMVGIQKSEFRIQNSLHVGFETSTGLFQHPSGLSRRIEILRESDSSGTLREPAIRRRDAASQKAALFECRVLFRLKLLPF